MKILYLTNIPSPYRVEYFNQLSEKCDLTVLYERKQSLERNKRWNATIKQNYRSVFLKGIRTSADSAFCPEVIAYLQRGKFDFIIICGIATITETFAILWCKLKKIPYIIESDGGFAKNGKGLKEKIKKFLITGAELYFSTGVVHDNYYITYGARPDRIKRYPFTSLTKADIHRAITIKKKNKNFYRDKLNIIEKKMILTVGRFSYNAAYRKGYDILLDIASHFDNDTGIYIVGDNPTEEFIRIREEKKLLHVHYVGFKTKEELAEYYASADVFVLLTREDIWGLVINEAMMYSLPIVTTNYCGAGLELITNGINGYIVDINSPEDILNKVNLILHNPKKSVDFGKKSFDKIQNYTIENMTLNHLEILKTELP